MAAGWLPPVQALNASGAGESAPHVAVDAAGNVYATWVEGSTLRAAKRPVGAGWETPQSVPLGTATKPVAPDIGVDSSGNAVLVWKAATSTGSTAIFQATRAAGATSFGSPSQVSNSSDSFVGAPRVEANGAGRAVLAYRDTFNATGEVTVAIGTATAGFSSATLRIYDETSSPFDPEDAIDASGDAVVAWEADTAGAPAIHAAYAPSGAGFPAGGAVETAGSGTASTPAFDVHVGIGASGRAVATWAEGSPSSGKIIASARTAGATGSWSEFKTALDGPFSGAGNEPDVAFDATGAAVAAWGGDGFLRSSVLAPGAAQFAQPPQTLAGATEDPSDIDLDSGPSGLQVLVWAAQSGAGSARAAVRPSGGSFGPIATLSAAGHSAVGTRVAVDATGNAAAVWVDQDTGLMTAEYDSTPPALTATVPSSGDAGTLVSMSASATDDWSAPGVAWDFGDGNAGTGAGVTHTYRRGGTYTVTATATDAAGNKTTKTASIEVAAVLPPPPKRGKTFNAATVSGTVLVSAPKGTPIGRVLARRPVVRAAAAISPPKGYLPFRPLGKNAHVPIGSILDSTRGVTQLTMAANKAGTKLQKGRFSKGAFRVKQTTHSPLTSAEMMGGGNFKRDCPRSRGKLAVGAARRRPHRQLFAHVKGRFRTRGRHSTATVRGTKYLVKDSCRGTLTIVTQGRVEVRDFRKHRTVFVKAGHRYLAHQ
jgi:PKD repeat protein